MRTEIWVASIALALAIAAVGNGCGAGPEMDDAEQAVAGPAPDYVVSAMSDPPAQAVAGTSFSIGVTVTNQGTAAATTTSTTRYFLSPDPVLDGDRAFAASTLVPALAVGASDARTVTLVIPSAPAGAYHVIACADRTAVIPELDNANNCRASTGTVLVSAADLVVESLADPPALAVPFESFSITDTTRNAGNTAAAASKVAYFLSTTPVRGASSVRLQPDRAVAALAAGAASTGSVSTFVPVLPPASYHLIACADIDKRVVEGDEKNNCRTAAGTLTIRAADLVVTSLAEPPAAATAGEVVELTATTANAGNLAAGFSSTRFFLSGDAQPGNDLSVVGGQLVPSLAEGQSHRATTRIGIPDTTPTGSYVLLACADAAGRIVERFEDNCRASTGTIAITRVAPAPALVTVHLLGHEFFGRPAPGQPVLAYDASGTLTSRVGTDASGTAQILVPAGGALTVVELAPRQLTTYYGLADGAEVTVGDLDSQITVWQTTLHVPVGTTPNNVYVLQGPCAISSAEQVETVPVQVWSNCGDAPRPIMATLFMAFSNQLMGYLFDPEVDVSPGGSDVLDGDWQPPFPFHLDVTGIPERFFTLPQEMVVERLAGPASFYTWSLGADGNVLEVVDPGHVVGTLHQGIGGDGTLTHLRFGANHILEYRREAATELVADLSADFVTFPVDPTLVLGELEPGGPVDVTGMRWTMDDGAAVDGMMIWIEKFRDEDVPPSSWTVVMPPRPIGPSEVALPALPSDLVPVWAGGQLNSTNIYAVDSPATSYAQFAADADPQRVFQWLRWQPSVPGKTRIGGTN